MFEKTLTAGWGDMDFNAHMRNTAFLDKSADVRMMFFADNGFPMSEFMRLRIGPIVRKDEIEYFKEVHLLEEVRVNLSNAGMSDDGSRFMLRNGFTRADGKLSARITSTGGWLNLAERVLVAPPPALLAALRSLPQTDDYQVLPTALK